MLHKTNLLATWAIATAVLALGGCHSQLSHVPTRSYPPSDPSAVQILTEPPRRPYEDLGEVQTPMQVNYGERYNLNDTADRLVALAAAKGANGLILPEVTGDNVATYGGYVHKRFLDIPVHNGTSVMAFGEAIYIRP